MKDSLRKTEANRMVIETEVDDSDAKLVSLDMFTYHSEFVYLYGWI